MPRLVAPLAFLLLAACSAAQDRFHVYVGELDARHVLIAWGSTQGKGNTIGRAAQGSGRAELTVGTKTVTTDSAWARVEGLEPDHEYTYNLRLNGRPVREGRVRTWPEHADRAAFLVVGDWGNGSRHQLEIAAAMTRVVREREKTDNPIRFVISTGDNIYSVIPGVLLAGSGNKDSHWEPRFFGPYREILASLPFYVVLGNHDGNESERRDDLPVQLDNFFFPGNHPARWYRFRYADLMDFIALDSTRNTEQGPKRPVWLEVGPQFAWAREAVKSMTSPWRLAVMHHPVFNAGPGHAEEDNEKRMAHWVDLLAQAGVQAVFHGHEHNFQVSYRNARSRNMRFFVTGAGGELRGGDVRSSMERSNVEGWAPQRHFLLVEVSRNALRVTPLAQEPVRVRRADGSELAVPITVPVERD